MKKHELVGLILKVSNLTEENCLERLDELERKYNHGKFPLSFEELIEVGQLVNKFCTGTTLENKTPNTSHLKGKTLLTWTSIKEYCNWVFNDEESEDKIITKKDLESHFFDCIGSHSQYAKSKVYVYFLRSSGYLEATEGIRNSWKVIKEIPMELKAVTKAEKLLASKEEMSNMDGD